ncbi:hypothetical protein [Streptomyces harbinensis]|uniref:Uncharacterized protein n=1 Tax=Streptomyces cheonanensis TaxID=312720 RepID=A0ABN2V7J2_9ACTN
MAAQGDRLRRPGGTSRTKSGGGASGGLLAIEQLRQVFNELQAHTVRDYLAFPRYYQLFDESGALREPKEPEAAAQAMLDQLHWWASVLRDARRDRPHPAA